MVGILLQTLVSNLKRQKSTSSMRSHCHSQELLNLLHCSTQHLLPRQTPVRRFRPAFYSHSGFCSHTIAPIIIEKKSSLDIILLCGSPGSGKSTFYWTKLNPLGYERINQDTLKTVRTSSSVPQCCISNLKPLQRDKCLKVASNLLAEKKSIAIGRLSSLLVS